jgi:hypothetical protein
MNDLAYMQAPWFATLKAEAERTSRKVVADLLGVSRTTVSLVLNGKYQGKTDKVAERVEDKLGGFACLYDHQTITPVECRATAQAAAPTHNPAKLAQWSACQRCPKSLKGGV